MGTNYVYSFSEDQTSFKLGIVLKILFHVPNTMGMSLQKTSNQFIGATIPGSKRRSIEGYNPSETGSRASIDPRD